MAEPETKWLSEPEMLAWRHLVRATTGLLAVLDNELQAEHGLSLGDYEVLVHLSEAPGRAVRMSELADRLHLSPSGITRRIDGLVKGGLVERQPCPSDRLSERELAQLAAALSSVDVDAARAIGGCDSAVE